MSVSASQLLHSHVGAPRVDGCADVAGVCWVCGATCARAMPRGEWMGSNFVGQNRVRAPASGIVCESCVWAMAGRPPDTLRMYTHLHEVGGEYHRLNKGDKPAMRAWLRRLHTSTWFAAIADSGQKHVVPWCPVNPPGVTGRVLLEESVVALPDASGWGLVDDAANLLTAGATKAEVESSRYEPRAWQLCRPQIEAFERAWGQRLRGGPWFALAIWLAQRDEETVAARMAAEKEARASGKARRRTDRTAANADGGGAPRGASGVPGNAGMQPAEALGPVAKPHAERGAKGGKRRRVGDDVVPRPATAGAEQLGLAGIAGPERGGA